MLVLCRKQDQAVLINGDIEVRVVQIRGGRVQLGFVAPLDVAIVRKEIRHKRSKDQPADEHRERLLSAGG